MPPRPTTPCDPTADGYALALEEARRALDEQERAVAQLSARAGMLLSAGAITTSFLGGQALSRGAIGASWIAIVTFAAFSGTALSILGPRRAWAFAMWPTAVIRTFVEPLDATPATPARSISRVVALHLEAGLRQNARELDRMMTTFHIAIVLLTIDTLAWVASIATTG